ncbi:hypothetical protein [Aliivibrio fischeri]|uniref:hypothetical protein n=1 Tax=Aliivibrio fischeri TaxID=668 RepID=UPI001F3388E4|nr:hypothetical protein [Aliivibrio fischeri]MCE7534836.1 hypothetical protein [Aliivibrio fischeri]MCE7557328.1 hypothetical protein [Aliivibrio fischeri]
MDIHKALEDLSSHINQDYPIDLKSNFIKNTRTFLMNFIDYVSKHPTTSYYPISRLYEASKCDTPQDVLTITNYLTSKRINFLDITFCYFPYHSDDVIEITAESYKESVTENLTPVNKITGEEVENFERSRLGFFCYVRDFD